MAASKNDFLADLAKKPPKVKAAILAGAMIFCGGIYYQFFYSGLVDEKQSEISTKKRAQAARDKLVKQLKERKQLIIEKRRLDKDVERMQKALPTEAELPAFFEHLQQKAGDAQVTIKSWRRQKEKPLGSFIQVPVKVVVTGNYHQIMHYFSLLGPKPVDTTASKTPDDADDNAPAERIVTIESLKLSGADAKNDEIVLQASFTASTFRKEEIGAKKRTRKKAAAKPKGGKGKVRAANEKRAKALDKAAGTKPGMADGKSKPGGAGVNRLTNPGVGAAK